MRESGRDALRGHLDAPVCREFQRATIAMDTGLDTCSERDDTPELVGNATSDLQDSPGSGKVQHWLVAQLRQSVYSHLVGCEGAHDEERLTRDPAERVVTSRMACSSWRGPSWPGQASLFLALVITGIIVACGGSDDGGPADQVQPEGIQPVLASSDLALGDNRFSLGLLSEDNRIVTDADVHLQFYKIIEEGVFQPATGAGAVYRSVTTTAFVHEHDDGEPDEHTDETGVYVAQVTFESEGAWSVTASGTLADGEDFSVDIAFQVQAESQTVVIGAPAPRTDNPTIDDVDDISEIDTSDPPRPHLHTISIADAIAVGRPTIVAFVSPAFCRSRLCGPELEVVDSLYEEYQDRVAFVHVEPYKLDVLQEQGRYEITEAAQEWNLPSEPWIFIVDDEGLVAAKFESVVTAAELEEALQQVLTST
jgi:hypothetical protein